MQNKIQESDEMINIEISDNEEKIANKHFSKLKTLHLFSEQNENYNNFNQLEEYYIKVEIKQIFEQDQTVAYTDFVNQQDEELENGQELVMYKKEFEFYIDHEIFEENQILKDNYVEEENIVQIAILCNEYIPYPSIESIEQYFVCSQQDFEKEIKNNSKEDNYQLFSTFLALENEKYGNLVFEQLNKKNYDLETVLLTLIISIQWDFKQFSQYSYKILKEFIFYMNGIITDNQIPEIKPLIQGLNNYSLNHESENQIINFKTDKYELSIDTLFFKQSFINYYVDSQEKFIVQNSYKEMKVIRQRSQQQENIIDDEPNTYPHYYELQNEHDSEMKLYAIQESKHSEINIFSQKDQKAIKFGKHYVGSIERNYWGTQFTVYDFGVTPIQFQQLPKYFSVERKQILQINYETNITASAPRKFKADVLNLQDDQLMTMQSMEPIFNEKKQCYQLNFYGRAKRASARNFELIPPDDNNTIYLLHGKMSKDQFSVDYRHPITSTQAFAFSLTSISKKFLVS